MPMDAIGALQPLVSASWAWAALFCVVNRSSGGGPTNSRSESCAAGYGAYGQSWGGYGAYGQSVGGYGAYGGLRRLSAFGERGRLGAGGAANSELLPRRQPPLTPTCKPPLLAALLITCLFCPLFPYWPPVLQPPSRPVSSCPVSRRGGAASPGQMPGRPCHLSPWFSELLLA